VLFLLLAAFAALAADPLDIDTCLDAGEKAKGQG
jgi:hypothetical protein